MQTDGISEKAKPSISPRLRLSVCAAADLPQYAHKRVTHILSINRPGFPTPTPDWFTGVHKHVFFQDVFSHEDAAALNAKAPTAADIKAILEFGRECLLQSKKADTHLVIHCMHGASRSPAAAYAILCFFMGKGREDDAMDVLLRIKPDVVPNYLVVAYADKLLSREGSMINAIQMLYCTINNGIDDFHTQRKEGEKDEKKSQVYRC